MTRALSTNVDNIAARNARDDANGTVDSLRALAAELTMREPALAPSERAVMERAARLLDRLAEGRFQLAVVGQFKRGKSSLLNALLDAAVLPTGVVPLTAIPTFIGYDPAYRVEVLFAAGGSDRITLPDAEALRALLMGYVTETGNPHNVQGVDRVNVFLPSPLLADGLILIDTPGIGSAERHNSDAALAALPDCDAALIVLSPDPPITEAEITYLTQVAQHAAHIVPVLTKADLVDDADLAVIKTYIAGVLSGVGIAEPILIVSAAAARRGIADLANHVRGLDAARTRLLGDAIALKLAGELRELAFQNDVALAALQLPLETLEEKSAEIASANEAILAEHRHAADITAGERQRLRDSIDTQAAAVRDKARAHLLARLDNALREDDPLEAFAHIAGAGSQFFSNAYDELAASVRDSLAAIGERAKARALPAIERMRQLAAETFGAAFALPPVTVELGALRELAWTEREAESMNPLPPEALSALLPERVRRQRRKRRLVREIERVVTLNTEKMRWTLRQQAEVQLRHFDSALDSHLRVAAQSIIDLAAQVRALRQDAEVNASEEIARREQRAAILARAA